MNKLMGTLSVRHRRKSRLLRSGKVKRRTKRHRMELMYTRTVTTRGSKTLPAQCPHAPAQNFPHLCAIFQSQALNMSLCSALIRLLITKGQGLSAVTFIQFPAPSSKSNKVILKRNWPVDPRCFNLGKSEPFQLSVG